MQIQHFFDSETGSLTYVVYDEQSKDAVVIDPLLDFDALAVKTRTCSIEKVAAFLRQQNLVLHYVLETHAHADHLSAAQYLVRRFFAKLGIGSGIVEVQKVFARLFDLGPDFFCDGRQFDLLIADGDVLQAGRLRIEALATPGHTPACLSYRIADAIFVGDALFIEDYGTGRCDFPGGDAEKLFDSIQNRLYVLPEATRVFVGHDYQPGGRPLRCETSILASRQHNVHLGQHTRREDFLRFRQSRDATLSPPRLFYQSLQVNIAGGRLPAPHVGGQRYLRLPLNAYTGTADDGSSADECRPPRAAHD